ncbi:MAG TPA: hypothetical protein VFO77_11995 [Actinoplanes sp.]|nr:hypothetical protein [Actinoplanes sp.]
MQLTTFRHSNHHEAVEVLTGVIRERLGYVLARRRSQRRTGPAAELGATLHEPPQDRGHGFATATVIDPVGNLLVSD